MKGGRGSNGAATDLLVCFPSRAHLALMPPKAICSPSRPSASSEPGKRRHSTSRAGPPPPSSAALFKAASRNPSCRGEDLPVDDEPSSPKVTCAGQIKARRPTTAAKPKIAGAKGKKATTWLQALGIKKVDALPFLNALQGAFRINIAGCFGSFPGGAVVEYTSGEDDDDEEEEEEDELAGKDANSEHGAALAKWFMVLEEGKKVSSKKRQQESAEKQEEVAPPANALMLMRCRSAPAKGIPRRLGGDAEEEVTIKSAKEEEEEEEEEEENKERLVLMSYAPDFFKVSVDIAKETWIVGGDDAVLRCRSWKR